MVLVRGDLDFNLISIRTDDEGRYIVLEAEVQGANFLLVNVYVPNKVQEQCRIKDISNWRPISLINVDVKIGPKAIAKRLECTVLPSIIAYVKGRTIFDAVRTVEDILEYTERFKINGRLIAIDFKKAFDSVSKEFLFRTLSAARFGSSFIQWIHTFYNNISSCVSNNGFATAHFDIQRGVRQGDPLSPYLFIIVLETLASTIRSDNDIRGIMVDGQEIKLGLFADDLTGFLRNEKSLTTFLELVLLFAKCSHQLVLL